MDLFTFVHKLKQYEISYNQNFEIVPVLLQEGLNNSVDFEIIRIQPVKIKPLQQSTYYEYEINYNDFDKLAVFLEKNNDKITLINKDKWKT